MKKLIILLLLASCSKDDNSIRINQDNNVCHGVNDQAVIALQELPDYHYYRLRRMRTVILFKEYIRRHDLLRVNEACLNYQQLFDSL